MWLSSRIARITSEGPQPQKGPRIDTSRCLCCRFSRDHWTRAAHTSAPPCKGCFLCTWVRSKQLSDRWGSELYRTIYSGFLTEWPGIDTKNSLSTLGRCDRTYMLRRIRMQGRMASLAHRCRILLCQPSSPPRRTDTENRYGVFAKISTSKRGCEGARPQCTRSLGVVLYSS